MKKLRIKGKRNYPIIKKKKLKFFFFKNSRRIKKFNWFYFNVNSFEFQSSNDDFKSKKSIYNLIKLVFIYLLNNLKILLFNYNIFKLC